MKSLLGLSQRYTLLKQSRDENSSEIKSLKQEVENYSIYFNLPGYDHYELKSNGVDIPVTISNLIEYVEAVTRHTLVDGVSRQVSAVIRGFNEVFPITALRLFTATELHDTFCPPQESWDREILARSIICQHGYTLQSQQVQDLLTVLSNLSEEERRLFLRFSTGCPRLPIGGWEKLRPRL